METIRFKTNIPETIALKYDDGLPVESPYTGDQICFTLTDGRKMYLAPFVADKIKAAGIRRHQEFEICKQEVKHGERRSIEYVINAGAPVKNAPAQTTTTETKQIVPAAKQAPVTNDSPAAAQPHSAAALLAYAGRAAIDVVISTEAYAQSQGMADFAFGPEQVEKLMACMFIEVCKRSPR
jgi:hypothetical protein